MTTHLIARRALLLAGSAGLVALAAPAAAQDGEIETAADAELVEDEVDTIIVTARRREERLLDVPVAVTAFSQQDLQNLQAVDLSGLNAVAPNLNLVQGRGSAASANIFIRGLGQPDALQTFDPAVGIYVDGV
jgi:iron complex outermembrane receptor protein